MNLNKFGRWSGIVAAVAMLAMVLQGCGGDDSGSGITQDMYDALQADYDDAVADRDVAVTARMDAMEAQATAEQMAMDAMEAQMGAEEAQTTAENAQAAAEALRDTANTERATALSAQADAEDAQADAEQAAMDAMQAQADAEAAADIAVAAAMEAQMMAEDERDDAEDARNDAVLAQTRAELMRDAAVAAETVAKEARDEALAAQRRAEDARDDALEAQMMAEDAAEAAMDLQKKAEMERDDALKAKMDAEGAKKMADDAKKLADEAQATAEMERDDALQAQMDAEAAQKTAEEERDAALAALSMQTDAEAAQRARVDGAAIKNSAGYEKILVPGVDVNGNGDFTDTGDTPPVRGLSTNVVDMFQGSGDIPGDGDPTMAGRQTGRMSLTATRVGNSVTFKATQDNDGPGADIAMTLIDNLPGTVGADGMTTATTGDAPVDLPGGHNKHIVLMSDIEAPGLRTFAAYAADHRLITNMSGFDVTNQRTQYLLIHDDPDTTDSETMTNVDAIDEIVIDFPVGFLPTPAVPAPVVLNGAAFDGSYGNVPGLFVCNTADGTGTAACNTERNADGHLLLTGVWSFAPSTPATAAPDGDYIVFGAWLKKPDSAVGSGLAAAISSGSDLFTAGSIAGLGGTATYNGDATGYYAERHVNSDTAESGSFTATATLDADFAAGGGVGALSGEITDFVRDDSAVVDWVVMLDEVALSNTTDDGGFVMEETSGSASGASWSGRWGVQLVGDGAATTQHPSGVVGTFGAQHGMPSLVATDTSPDEGFAAVIGGFGARK